jgi:hypothetical protein
LLKIGYPYSSVLYIYLVAILGVLILSAFNLNVNAQRSSINWYELCTNPVVDILISEPCGTLTTDDGYTLTPEGERVLACLGGGALALAQPELMALKSLAPCGSNHSTGDTSSNTDIFSNNQKGDPLGSMLNSLFG